MLSRQMPARSPIPGRALPRITLQTVALGDDPRTRVHSLLLQRYRANGCRLLGSGTQSLQAALELAAALSNEPVLLPAYSCYEVASAAVGANVRVALYDVDVVTLEPDWESVRRAARQGASAIVVAPLYGLPLDWERARSVADELGLLLIADVAQAHGTMWRGEPAGTVADMTIVSFGRGKGWTGAGGGALLWRGRRAESAITTDAQVDAAHTFVTEAKSAAKAGSQWLLGRRSLYALPAAIPFLKLGETIYHDPSKPVVMTRTSAALLLATETDAAQEVLHRRRNARAYANGLERSGFARARTPGAAMDDTAGALRFPVRVAHGLSGFDRNTAAKWGVAQGYPQTLCELPALSRLIVNVSANISGAQTLAREVITLPTHSQVTASDVERIVQMISSETRAQKGVARVRQNRV
jgi:perosamine synthetase